MCNYPLYFRTWHFHYTCVFHRNIRQCPGSRHFHRSIDHLHSMNRSTRLYILKLTLSEAVNKASVYFFQDLVSHTSFGGQSFLQGHVSLQSADLELP